MTLKIEQVEILRQLLAVFLTPDHQRNVIHYNRNEVDVDRKAVVEKLFWLNGRATPDNLVFEGEDWLFAVGRVMMLGEFNVLTSEDPEAELSGGETLRLRTYLYLASILIADGAWVPVNDSGVEKMVRSISRSEDATTLYVTYSTSRSNGLNKTSLITVPLDEFISYDQGKWSAYRRY